MSPQERVSIFLKFLELKEDLGATVEATGLNLSVVSDIITDFTTMFDNSQITTEEVPLEAGDVTFYIFRTETELLIETVELNVTPDTVGELLYVTNEVDNVIDEYNRLIMVIGKENEKKNNKK